MNKLQMQLSANLLFNLASKQRLGSTVLVVFVCSLLIYLGLWQLERASFKQERLQKMTDLKASKSFYISDLPAVVEERQDLPISMLGNIVEDHRWYIENIIVGGVLGVDVIVLFDVVGEDKFVFVNLGWLPVNLQRQPLAEHKLVSKIITLEGVVRNYAENYFMSDEVISTSWGLSLQQVNPVKLAQSLGIEAFDFIVLIESEQELANKTHWQAVVMSPEKHRAYAVQWFLLAGCFFILMLCWDRYHAREK